MIELALLVGGLMMLTPLILRAVKNARSEDDSVEFVEVDDEGKEIGPVTDGTDFDEE